MLFPTYRIYFDKVDLSKKRILKLDVRFANIRQLVSQDSAAFEKIIEVCNQIECRTAHLELGLGRSYTSTDELEPETIQGIIQEVVSEKKSRSSIFCICNIKR